MLSVTKTEAKALRNWAETAWDRELSAEITKLGIVIDALKTGELSPQQVNDLIHEFHDGVARDLYRFYTRASPEMAVAHALVGQVIAKGELPLDLYARLLPLVEIHEKAAARKIADIEPAAKPRLQFTALQGQYLAFIDSYLSIHGIAPAEADMQEYFKVTPATVHQMVLTLERHELISRVPGEARSIKMLVTHNELPELGGLSVDC